MASLEKDLQQVLTSHQAERADQLPEEVVAKYLVKCLDNISKEPRQYESLEQPLDM
jgi:hypothetical protein